MQRGFWSFDGFEVGAHDIGDATDLGITPEVVCRGFLLRSCILQRLQRYVEPDFVPMLEAVGYGFGDAVYPDINLVDSVRFDALRESIAGVLDKLERRVIHLRRVATLGQGGPDLPRKLRG